MIPAQHLTEPEANLVSHAVNPEHISKDPHEMRSDGRTPDVTSVGREDRDLS